MDTSSNAHNLITPQELSKLFKISTSSIYRLVDKRTLPFYKIGGNLRFSLNDINGYLNDVRIEPVIKQYERIQKSKQILD